MSGAISWGNTGAKAQAGAQKTDVEVKMLRSKLVTLTQEWELSALALDAQRYQAPEATERESLSDSATTYRKCIWELTEVLSSSFSWVCKT